MSSFPYVRTTDIFNTADYNILDQGLTIETANKLYLSINDGKYITGITEGVAQVSKALVLDSSRNITNINQISLTGKLVLDQAQSIGFYRNTATLDLNSYIAPESGNTSNLTLYSLRGNGSVKILANSTGTNPLFLVNATNSTTPSATDYLRILGNGNIGISNNNPAYLLDVSGSINSNTNIQVNRTANGECFNFSNGTVSGAIHCQTSQAHIGTTSNHGFNLQTNGTNRLLINNTGNITISNTASGLQLDLGSTGTGLNVPNLQFQGTTVNLNYYTLITEGGAVAQKAVVLNSTLDYSGIRDLSITRNFIASTSIASPSITCNSLSASTGITTASLTVNGDANITNLLYSNGIQILNSSRQLQNISYLDFSNTSLFYKAILRKDTSGGAGLEVFDSQFSTPSQRPLINFKTANNSDPIFFRLCGYLNDNSTMVANGQPFYIQYTGGVGFTSGLNITCSNTTQASNSNYNVVLSARNGTIPHVVVNDSKNQLHLWPQNAAELNTSYVQNTIIGSDLWIRKTLQIGTSQDNARLISALDNTMSSGSTRYFTLGRDNNSKNQAEISFYYDNNNSSSNRLDFGFYGGALMFLRADGKLGIGTSSPRCPLEVNGANSVTTTTNIAVNTYFYNLSNGTWSNGGGGPYTATLSCIFSSNVWVQDKLYCTSDRRLKTYISSLDFTLEHYMKLNPVSYRWKNDNKLQLGLIAQEVKEICSESINIVENENLKVEEDGDIEGFQYTVDYNCINMMNIVAIKKLIEKNKQLEDRLKIVEDFINTLEII